MDYFAQCVCELTVRPSDLDAFGHVDNATVLEYLESARWDWLSQMSLPVTNGAFVVVARIEVDYLETIGHGRVRVRTTLQSPTGPRESKAAADEFVYRVRMLQRRR